VHVLPVLDGTTYVGAVDRGSFSGDVPDTASVGSFAMPLVPTALATTPASEAFAALDRADARRLVVLDGDRSTYVGLVCMRCDREHFCVDVERLGLAH
jgi:CBS domain-containing protein